MVVSEIYVVKDELSQLNGEQRNIFLNYLHKSLEDMTINWENSGTFVNYQLGDINAVDQSYFIGKDILTLQLHAEKVITLAFESHWKKGIVDHLEISCTDSLDCWKEFISKKITMALASAFAQKMESFFFRKTYYYIGNKLDGDYYIQNWRISPATPKVMGFIQESAIYFDMNVEGINYTHAYSKSEAMSKEVMAILSVILNKGIYSPPHEFKWAYIDGSDDESKLFKIGYQGKEPYPEEMPIKKQERLGKFVEPNKAANYNTNGLYPPNNIRKLFKAYQNLEYDEKNAFLSAAKMFQIALSLGSRNNTVNSSYQIAALDALSKPIRENNRNKNAIMTLVSEYCPGYEAKVGKLYDSVRSAHFHQGFFSESDVNGQEIRPFMGPNIVFNDDAYYTINGTTRTVLIKWLTQRIPQENL